jgi:arylsulfatase A-like enzyme/Tfp pilus assembly protein PilF
MDFTDYKQPRMTRISRISTSHGLRGCCLAAGLAAGLTACGERALEGPVADKASVLLITVDTLRADRVGAGVTSAIDALAESGVRFTSARANAPLTLPSHVTVMTGALPPSHGVRENGSPFAGSQQPLAQLFKERGYRTGAFVGAFVLDHSFGLAAGFDTYDDRIPRRPGVVSLEAERPAQAVGEAAVKWLIAPADRSQPFFLWAHFYDPHAPYAPPPEYAAQAGGKAYEGEIAYADAELGRLVRATRERTADSALVVAIAGDHGESLGDHGEPTHGMLLYESAIRVPLVVAAWKNGAKVNLGPAEDSRAVSLQDLAPTLLTLAGTPVPSSMTGSALFGVGEGRGTARGTRNAAPPEARGTSSEGLSDSYAETVYPRSAGWSPLRSLTDGRWKLIVSSRVELYDLAADAGERQDVSAANASVALALRTRLDKLWRPAGAPAVSAEAAERLRALGYVSSAADPAPLDKAPNPADEIAAWATFERAFTDLSSGRAAEAVQPLASLAGRYPAAVVFQSAYARALSEAGRPRDALQRYRAIVARWPRDPTQYHELAVAARNAGAAAEAIKAEEAAIALDPKFASAYNGLGLLHADAGRAREAAAAFARAVELDPRDPSVYVNLGNARRELKEVDAARFAYQTALRLAPDDVDAANGLGVLLLEAGRPLDAVVYFDRVLQRAPGMYQARLNLGVAYQQSAQLERAAEAYRAVIDSAPPGSRERDAATTLLRQLTR